MTTPPPTSPAGWFSDPGGTNRQRYFDGKHWTDHYSDTAAAPPDRAASTPSNAGGNRRTIFIAVGAFVAGLVISALASGGSGSSTSSAGGTNTTTVTASAPAQIQVSTITQTYTPPPPPGPARQLSGEGIYVVGTDIVPGRWRTQGGSGSCYWARLADLTGDDILDNNNSTGPQVVDILPSDSAFQLSHCGQWYLEGS